MAPSGAATLAPVLRERWRQGCRKQATGMCLSRLPQDGGKSRRGLAHMVLHHGGREGVEAGIGRVGAELFGDSEQAVVFLGAIGTAGGAGLDLGGRRAHGQVGDEGIRRFPRPVRDDGTAWRGGGLMACTSTWARRRVLA